MGVWDSLAGAISRGGMSEGMYDIYRKKSDSELVRLAKINDVNALKMLKIRKKDDEMIKRMLKRGY